MRANGWVRKYNHNHESLIYVTAQMKATEQYFPVVLFIMLYKVIRAFESVRMLHSEAESQLRTSLSVRPNVFKTNSINTDKAVHAKIQSMLSN